MPITNVFLVTLVDRMLTQQWVGICDVKFERYGRGVITLQRIQKDDIICDYHGDIIKDCNFTDFLETTDDISYCLEVPTGPYKRIINAHKEICEAHPNVRCLGRLVNHALDRRVTSNIKPVDIGIFSYNGERAILLKARRIIEPFEQLRFDYKDKNARKTMLD